LSKEFSHDLPKLRDEVAYYQLLDAIKKAANNPLKPPTLKLGDLELRPKHLNYLEEGDIVEVFLNAD